jgi:hypothetical protein
MAVAEQEQTEQHDGQQQDGQSGSRTALKAAAAAAATGAATFAVRKALSHGEHDDDGDDESPRGKSKQNQSAGSILSTAASSAWDSASEVVLPMAEDAVAAAGRYLAERAPDVVRERLVPRFIEAFNEAN